MSISTIKGGISDRSFLDTSNKTFETFRCSTEDFNRCSLGDFSRRFVFDSLEQSRCLEFCEFYHNSEAPSSSFLVAFFFAERRGAYFWRKGTAESGRDDEIGGESAAVFF